LLTNPKSNSAPIPDTKVTNPIQAVNDKRQQIRKGLPLGIFLFEVSEFMSFYDFIQKKINLNIYLIGKFANHKMMMYFCNDLLTILIFYPSGGQHL